MKNSIKDLIDSSSYNIGQKKGIIKGAASAAALLVALFAAVAGASTADTNKYKEQLENDIRHGGANNR